ncbi:MAG: hypothetical protein DRH06_03110, partial [Deltaproteobacteria bacterium]
MQKKKGLRRGIMTSVLLSLVVLLVGGLYAATNFTPAVQPVGYVPQPVTSSFFLASGNEDIFIPSYDKTVLAGNIFSHPISSSAVIDIGNQNWNAAALLDAVIYTDRKIVTMGGLGGVALTWGALSEDQQDEVNADPDLGDIGEQVINYIRGDRSNEEASGAGGILRNRSTILGPIVHSQPTLHAGNLYIGANDGLLHVFDSSSGAEKWAYLPTQLLGQLQHFATVATLDYLVDGLLTIGHATIDDDPAKILVGTFGAGGKGLYALDVTAEPTTLAEAEAKVLWEVAETDSGFDNLGYGYSGPLLARVHAGSGDSVDAVIVGNGYENLGNGHATLLILDASDGSLIKELDVQPLAATHNGLSTPAVADTDGDGIIDYVYAGDLDGTLWKFDLSDDDDSNWSSTALYNAG